jgi:hypothetical protein
MPPTATARLASLVGAAALAVVPWLVTRTGRIDRMRAGLAEVLAECRARYAAAATAADTAAADAWRPAYHGVERPGDPTCGPYRRRNMLPAARR